MSVLIDNWTLQDVGETLNNGLEYTHTQRINVDSSQNSYHYEAYPRYRVQLECLINLLNDIIFREEMIVEPQMINAWNEFPQMRLLEAQKIIKPSATLESSAGVQELKKYCIQQVCINKGLQKTQEENEQEWRNFRRNIDPLFSQIVWGTAGYLARSYIFEKPYSPYSLRKHFLNQTIFAPRIIDAVAQVNRWFIEEGQTAFQEITPNSKSNVAKFTLPPAVVEVIEESKTRNDLIIAAFQARDEYRKLRHWIEEYQTALMQEDTQKIIKSKKIMQSVSDYAKGKFGNKSIGETKLSFRYSLFGLIDISKQEAVPDFRNKFGVRAAMSGLILTKRARSPLKKLIEMLGVEKGKSEIILNEIMIAEQGSFL